MSLGQLSTKGFMTGNKESYDVYNIYYTLIITSVYIFAIMWQYGNIHLQQAVIVICGGNTDIR